MNEPLKTKTDQIVVFTLDELLYALPLRTVIRVIHSMEIRKLTYRFVASAATFSWSKRYGLNSLAARYDKSARKGNNTISFFVIDGGPVS